MGYNFICSDNKWNPGIEQTLDKTFEQMRTTNTNKTRKNLPPYTQRKLFGILLHQTEIRLYLPFSDYYLPLFTTLGIEYAVHAEKSFRNRIKSNRNQIVFTIFRLIWNSKRTVSVCCSKSIGKW